MTPNSSQPSEARRDANRAGPPALRAAPPAGPPRPRAAPGWWREPNSARPSASRIEHLSGSRSRARASGTVAAWKLPSSSSRVPFWNSSYALSISTSVGAAAADDRRHRPPRAQLPAEARAGRELAPQRPPVRRRRPRRRAAVAVRADRAQVTDRRVAAAERALERRQRRRRLRRAPGSVQRPLQLGDVRRDRAARQAASARDDDRAGEQQ